MIRGTTRLLVAGLLVLLGACSSGAETPEPSAPDPVSPTQSPSGSSEAVASPSADEADRVVEISVSVRDGSVSPKPRRVEVDKDSQVRLLVTSDTDDTVHVHGFEVEEPLEAGRTTTVEFVADEQGVFEVETHDSELELLQLEVR